MDKRDERYVWGQQATDPGRCAGCAGDLACADVRRSSYCSGEGRECPRYEWNHVLGGGKLGAPHAKDERHLIGEARMAAYSRCCEIATEMGLQITGWYRSFLGRVQQRVQRGAPAEHHLLYSAEGIGAVRVSYTGRGGSMVAISGEAFDEAAFRRAAAEIVPRDHPYYELSTTFAAVLAAAGLTSYSVYPTTYGIGIWVVYNGQADKQADAVRALMERAGAEYYNEFSRARWVFRFKISKSKDNVKKIKALMLAAA